MAIRFAEEHDAVRMQAAFQFPPALSRRSVSRDYGTRSDVRFFSAVAAPIGDTGSESLTIIPRALQMRMREQSDITSREEPESGAGRFITGRHETELERYDRNLTEQMGELRVALPGVQVLFAFLLVIPFNQRFGELSHFERRLYFATLLCTLLAAILLVAPTLVHRLEFARGEKGYVVRTTNRLMIAGLSVFAVAMTCAVLLITHYLFGPPTAIITTAIVVCAFGLIWFGMPLHRRVRRRPPN